MEKSKNKKIVATIEARMTSSRLPGKVLMEIRDKPVLQHIIERLRNSKMLDDIVVATTVNQTDDAIVALCKAIGCSYFRGSEEDVLLRVLDAAKSVEADIIVEITGDCPVIDWNHVDYLIEQYLMNDYDYVSNVIKRTFPRGFDTQVFSVKTLDKVNTLTNNPVDHEHVSCYIYQHPNIFKLWNWDAPKELNHPEYEITLDTKEDFILIKNIYDLLYPSDKQFTSYDVVQLLNQRPDFLEIVKKITRKHLNS